MSRDILLDGLFQGRLPNRKEFYLYYLELTTSQFHIFDGQDTDIRKHLLSVRIDASDVAGVETKVRKGEFRFYLNRPGDGKYVFKVPSETVREEWISKLQRVINKEGLDKIQGLRAPSPNTFSPDNVCSQTAVPTKFDIPSIPKSPPTTNSRTLPGRGRTSTAGNNNSTSVLRTALPPPPIGSSSPRDSVISTDSGIGNSVGGEIRRPPLNKGGSTSVPNSGSGMVSRGADDRGGGPHSADAEFQHRVKVCDEDSPKWFWGTMNRQDCEDRLRTEGEIGNFVIRVNATGHHIMSFWRADGVHHHKILHHDGQWRFEKAAVNAEGESLADLLDTYMKNCTKDKNIKPFGGGLFQNYTYAWTPQEFDMELLGKKLKQQKELREKAKKPRKKQEYTPVEIDTGLNDDEGGFENDPLPGEEQTIKIKTKPLPLPPTKSSGPGTSPRPLSKPKKQGPAPPKKPGSGLDSPERSSTETSPAAVRSKQLGNPGPSTGMALIQELSNVKKKGGKKPGSNPLGGGRPPQPPAKPDVSSTSDVAVEEDEPVYANTEPLQLDSSEDTKYQNWEFNGPPETTPSGDSGEHYQNVGFKTQKPENPPSTKKKPPKTGPTKSPKPSASSRPTNHISSGAQLNGSLHGNSAGEYQNIGFKKQRH